MDQSIQVSQVLLNRYRGRLGTDDSEAQAISLHVFPSWVSGKSSQMESDTIADIVSEVLAFLEVLVN